MRRKFFFFLFVSALFFSCAKKPADNQTKNSDFSLEIVDDLNDTLRFKNYPEKIISLAPNLTEMIFALNAGEKLVANTTYCNYPDAAKRKEKIGDMFSVNYEKIASLKPDLILMTVEGNNKGSYEKLTGLGFKVFVSNPRNYEGIVKTFSDLGRLLDEDSLASVTVNRWNEKLKKIVAERKMKPRQKTLFLISTNPLMSASGKTFINEYLKYCNLQNVAEDSPVNYPILNREEILRRNPELIIVQQSVSKEDLIKQFPEWKNLYAIKENRIIEINPDLYFRPGPRFVEALEDLDNKLKGME